MISLEKSVSTWQFPVNKVIKFGPCWEAPYLWLVTYWQWHYRISWENGGRITKTPALRAGAPFPFPSFVLFSLPLPLSFLRLPRRLNIFCITCFKSVLRFFWFLEYRAELYWRLENKRMEKLSKENTPCNGDQTVDQNNNADNYKSKEVGEKVSKLKKWQGGRIS